jgi:hypothetical protein
VELFFTGALKDVSSSGKLPKRESAGNPRFVASGINKFAQIAAPDVAKQCTTPVSIVSGIE